MKKLITASTFPPKHNLCHYFSFSIKFPKDLYTVPTSTRTDKCPKCNSFLLQSEHICPVCDPINYYQKKSTTFFNSFRINLTQENLKRIFFIIFDLDLPIEELLKFSKILLELGEKEEFKNYYFYFGFLGYEISFLSCCEDQIQFLFIPPIKDFDSFVKPLKYFEKYLPKAIRIAKSLVKPSLNKKQAIENLFSFMQSNPTFLNIQDMIYVYSDAFPIQIKYNFKPRFHLIQITKQISKLNIDFSCRFKASFFSSPHVNESISNHLQKLLRNEMILLPHFTIATSPGIVFKEFNGPIQSSNQTLENMTNVDLFSCTSQAVPIFSCSKMDKKRYDSNKFFSYQLVLYYFSNCIFVFNDVYAKAKDMNEWIQSLNRDFFLFTIFQSYCNDLLNSNIHLNAPWRIINRNAKLGREFKKFNDYSNLIQKFFNELFHLSSSLLTDNQKAYILFYFCYGSYGKAIRFISSLFGDENSQINKDSNFILLNPILFVNEKDPIIEIDKHFLKSHPIFGRMDEKQFNALKRFINSIQKDLQSS